MPLRAGSTRAPSASGAPAASRRVEAADGPFPSYNPVAPESLRRAQPGLRKALSGSWRWPMTKLDCRRCGSPIPLPAAATLQPSAVVVCAQCGARYARRSGSSSASTLAPGTAIPTPEPISPSPPASPPSAPQLSASSNPTASGHSMPQGSTQRLGQSPTTLFQAGRADLGALPHPPLHRAGRHGRGLRGRGSRAPAGGGSEDRAPARRRTRDRDRALQARDPPGAQGHPRQRLPDLRRRLPRATGRDLGHLSHDGVSRRRDALEPTSGARAPCRRPRACRSPAR